LRKIFPAATEEDVAAALRNTTEAVATQHGGQRDGRRGVDAVVREAVSHLMRNNVSMVAPESVGAAAYRSFSNVLAFNHITGFGASASMTDEEVASIVKRSASGSDRVFAEGDGSSDASRLEDETSLSEFVYVAHAAFTAIYFCGVLGAPDVCVPRLDAERCAERIPLPLLRALRESLAAGRFSYGETSYDAGILSLLTERSLDEGAAIEQT
jgi:hypothetical protein